MNVGDVYRWTPAPDSPFEDIQVVGEVLGPMQLRVLSVSGTTPTFKVWRGWPYRMPAFRVGDVVDWTVSPGRRELLAPGAWNDDPGDEDRSER